MNQSICLQIVLSDLVLSAIAKMLMYGRRNPDESQKQQAAAVSAVLADAIYKHLTEYTDGTLSYIPCKSLYPHLSAGDLSISYAYRTVMLGLITVLLFDGALTVLSYTD